MLKKILTVLTLTLLELFGPPDADSATPIAEKHKRFNSQNDATETLQKMIVETGTVTMDLDFNRLNGIIAPTQKLETLRFAVAINSFFSILVFNDLLRGPQEGSMVLIAQGSATVPAALSAFLSQVTIDKLPSTGQFDLAVRDAKAGFALFNVQGHQYDYDAAARLLTVNGGRLMVSRDFANALGRPSDTGAIVGEISIGAAMQPVEIKQLVNGEPKSVVMPPLGSPTRRETPTLVQGPDVIVGDLPALSQFGSAGTQVGLAVATTSCNNGNQELDWQALPDIDHPVIPQNLYRMSGGTDNTERFEQVGQSWLKHAFAASEDDACNLGCDTSGCTQGTHLCPGCSDPYNASLNASQNGLGSRAWVNSFTGAFLSGANNHGGHIHTGTSHRILVEVNDLNTSLNQGASYFAEAQYVTPHEYAWCLAHPGECNMYNNASYRKYTVIGTTNFAFNPDGPTMRMQPAIMAWTGAIANQINPDPGNDGIGLLGYKVTNPSAGRWHYEYAIYNENMDRAIQSFSVPIGSGVNVTNIGFHAPPQHPGFAHDGTQGDAGFSSTPWTPTQTANSLTWTTEAFVQNPNANAIRWGTLYNFRFDADQPPQPASATIGFFKTGLPVAVDIQAPMGGTLTPTPRPSPVSRPRPTPAQRPTPR